MGELSLLPNIGKVLEHNLIQAGITTPEELYSAGAKEAFMRIRVSADPDACLHMLYGLQGAVEGIRDTLLSTETKQDLKSFFNNL